jgi:hypothetical protein
MRRACLCAEPFLLGSTDVWLCEGRPCGLLTGHLEQLGAAVMLVSKQLWLVGV